MGKTYCVFLSFRGKDIRNTFVGHLYGALTREGLETFRDDVKLQRGKEISSKLLKAIRNSKMSIVVLSKDYASSSWCLNELLEILECKRTKGHVVLPIFYDVNPSVVRDQTGSFAKAFKSHKRRYDASKVDKWREALVEVAKISAYNLKNDTNG